MISGGHGPGLVIAYIDPGSGYMMLQMLGAAVIGGWFYLRRSVRRGIERMLGRAEPNGAARVSSSAVSEAASASIEPR
jgi:hypothetical protein